MLVEMELDSTRILHLNKQAFDGKCVLYVMGRDQRTTDNHALLYAQALAKKHEVPLYVGFFLREVSQARSSEHYEFMLAGLEEVASSLKKKHIPFILRTASSHKDVIKLIKDTAAGAVVFDFSPLKGPRALQKKVASELDVPVAVVDSHNIIPAWKVSDKQEFAAHTMRRKVHKLLEKYLQQPPHLKTQDRTPSNVDSMSFEEADKWVQKHTKKSGIDIAAKPGEAAAKKALKEFIDKRLKQYAQRRNDFSEDFQSELSPYLHYGQLASLTVALDVLSKVGEEPLLFRQAKMAQAGEEPSFEDGINALYEEMIVRKELSDNFCLHSPSYTTLEGAPEWARKSLEAHEKDKREETYTRAQWEKAATHDEAWNAAQTQLMTTGKLHGYMRTYWAKKMLEWSPDPATALKDCIYLNDKYSVDGGDPNGYVGILWSIAGLHDRPWTEREVFGKIRYMNSAGLARKYDLKTYVSDWS